MDYQDLMENVAATYGPKALDLLGAVRDLCRAENLTTDEPADTSSDDYEWSLMVWPTDERIPQAAVRITLGIAEQQTYEGEDAGEGLNFHIDIIGYDGLILGGLSPFNYTDECWVDARDAEAVEARWQILAGADISEIPGLVPCS